jgi:hypothetical protein
LRLLAGIVTGQEHVLQYSEFLFWFHLIFWAIICIVLSLITELI